MKRKEECLGRGSHKKSSKLNDDRMGEEARPQKLMQKMKEMMTKHSMSLLEVFFS